MVEQVMYEQLKEMLIGPFASVSFLQAVSGDGFPRLVVWQVDDPSSKTVLSAYGGQARVQCDVWSQDRFALPTLRAAVRDAVREIRGVFGSIRIVGCQVTNDFTRALNDEELYSGVVDVIVHWEDYNGS